MFYSQFILAKKGPLGTIWIAAHLERKLRKNQVTDTDIGVSVDSILFPDVPIALRLSSHLLLGVVRIYNRKVNYLFDDCSEALLKVKQAFRSAAVDLPPEESKAPYHSITLPETFDLDDFELPENEILQGNYVDHHVSSREQITLQDTMDGVVYSTSQFGLDERFGDGETSQIGLDLEEELFLDKDATLGDNIFSKSDPQGFDETTTIIKNDLRDRVTMLVDDDGDQAPACDDHVEPEDQDQTESAAAESGQNIPNKPDHQTGEKNILDHSLDNDSILDIPHENGCHSGDMEREMRNSQKTPEINAMHVVDGALIGLDGHNSVENNGGLKSVDRTDGEFAESPSCSNVTYDNNEDAGRQTTSNHNLVPASDGYLDNEQAIVKQADIGETTSPCGPTIVDDETQACLEQKNSAEEVSSARTHVLQPCTSRHDQPDISSLEGEPSEALPNLASQVQEIAEGFNHVESQPILSEKIQEDGGNSDKQQDNLLSGNNQSKNSNDNGTSDLPAPEQLLSVPEGDNNRPANFLVGSTPDKVVAVETDGLSSGTKLISGRKRNYTESTLTVESINSVESFGQTRPKRTADSVPDDDDLLSSILVGRRSSVLKMKPTPAFEVASAKRTRTATRPTVSKRKVLMDDTMVLLGDTIRQHLTDTEDIRRVRKKAPCTRPEIAMLQRQFLEEEIFRETIFTGTSAELRSLRSGTYDLSGITISEVDENHSSAEVAKDAEFSVRPDVTNETGAEALVHGDYVEEQSAGAQPHIDGVADVTESLQNEPLNETAEMEIDERTAVIADAANSSALDELSSPIDPNQILNTQAVDGIDILAPEVENIIAVESETKTADAFLVEEDKPSASVDINTDVQPECTLHIENGNDSIEALYLETGEFPNSDQTADEFRTDKVGESNEDLTKDDMELEGKDPTNICCDEAKVDSVLSVEPDSGVKASSSDGEKPAVHEVDAVDAEVTAQESGNVVIENNTDFLNVDDELGEDDDKEDMQDGEENGILDNSGWSSRTRAVAKYLQNLFDNEAAQGKKVLVVDGLLSGKTRKEASRMFFETLVLKTKDYIQVEQPRPYDNISVKSRGKLMKSNF